MSFFEDKKNLKDNKLASKNIKAKYISGYAKYKDYNIVFIEEKYNNDRKITEAIACKETPEGWKITNETASDKTFDIVFAAVNSGEIIPTKEEEKELQKKKD